MPSPKAHLAGDPPEPPLATAPAGSIFSFIERAGFTFSRELVTTYLLSLRTKPFAILSGVSGTGKTKLAQLVAEWAGTTEEKERVASPAARLTDSGFELTLQPYMRKFRRFVVPRAVEGLLALPNSGSVPVKIVFEEHEYEGHLALLHKKRELYAIRFPVDFTAALFARVEEGATVRIEVENGAASQTLRIDPRAGTVGEVRTVRKTRHEFVSVRPDWLDGKNLLGYWNPIAEEYVAPAFLRLLLRAHAESVERGATARPHFVILDEMNLARVEHYFSDLLSATESRRVSEAGVRQEPLALHTRARCEPLEAPAEWEPFDTCSGCAAGPDDIARCSLQKEGVQLIPPKVPVPLNLYVTGTVNVDETTHMFSPKVLDRSNVIEFNDVWLRKPPRESAGLVLKDGLVELGEAPVATFAAFQSAPRDVQDAISSLNDLLRPHNVHFGFRVASEIASYVANAEALAESTDGDVRGAALDLQILQKVLPKLHGPRSRIEEPLSALLRFTIAGPGSTGSNEPLQLLALRDAILAGEMPPEQSADSSLVPRFPRSARKLARMHEILEDAGFVAFIE